MKRAVNGRSDRSEVEVNEDEIRKGETRMSLRERKSLLKRREGGLTIELININNLDKQKMGELEELFFGKGDEYRILCLTETHHKWKKIETSEGLESFTKMRKVEDKKGGGLQILMKKHKQVNFAKRKSMNRDILEIEGRCFGMQIKIILVYFDSNKGESGRSRNEEIRKEVESKIKKNRSECLLILGDLNAHLSLLEDKKEDANGKMVKKWIEDYDLMLMNADDRCKGKYTWAARGQKSAIDFVFVNRKLYEVCGEMRIDERKDIFDLSDHCLVSLDIKTRENGKNKFRKKRWKSGIYYRKDKNAMKDFGNEVEKRWSERRVDSIEEMVGDMKEAADKTLKRRFKRMVGSDGEEIEIKRWMTYEILDGIKERRRLNRERRNCKDEVRKEELRKAYEKQKWKVKGMVKKAVEEDEIKLKEEIEEGDGSGCKVWENLNKLRGKEKKRGEEEVYEEGKKLGDEEAAEKLMTYCREMYTTSESKMSELWNREKMNELIQAHENDREIDHKIREHMDMAMDTKDMISPMKKPEMKENDIKDGLKKLRNNKATGRDGLRSEWYKELGARSLCRETMIRCMNSVTTREEAPKSWKTSRTKLIRKTRRPTVKDYRPIALLDVGYKLYMGFIKNEIEEHIRKNHIGRENQIGCTKGGRLEYGHLILQHLIEEVWDREWRKTKMVVIALDFSKAFDSIDRRKLLETMIDLKINPYVIDLITKLYDGDETVIEVGGREERLKISTGIKQGCTASAVLFKIITFEIMKILEKRGAMVEVGRVRINSLFYSDDSLLVARTMEEAKENLELIKEASETFGLKINEKKSKIMIYKSRKRKREEEEEMEEVEGIEVVKKLKYLGLEICDDRDIFKEQKEEMIERATKMALQTYSVIDRSCNKVLMGKLYWKSIVLPSILLGVGLMNFTKDQIERLQRVENSVIERFWEREWERR